MLSGRSPYNSPLSSISCRRLAVKQNTNTYPRGQDQKNLGMSGFGLQQRSIFKIFFFSNHVRSIYPYSAVKGQFARHLLLRRLAPHVQASINGKRALQVGHEAGKNFALHLSARNSVCLRKMQTGLNCWIGNSIANIEVQEAQTYEKSSAAFFLHRCLATAGP